MCIIICSPQGSIPNTHLAQGLSVNPDGWGYVFHAAKTKRAVARHGMTPDEFWKAWKADSKARFNRPVIFHARIGTSGTKTTENCHPLEVPNHGMWLAHNGIIHGYGDDKVNDTRHFIDHVLAGLPRGWLGCESIRLLVEASIGYSKFAIMNGKGEVTILNEHLGHWHAGRWYSNCSYQPPAPKPVATTATLFKPEQMTGKVKHGSLAAERNTYIDILTWRRSAGLPCDDA